MKLKEFKNLVGNHLTKNLVFSLPNGAELRTGYHLSEVKKARFETLDCGSKKHVWDETIIQLWNPDKEEPEPVLAKLADSVIDKVSKTLSLDDESELVFEFGQFSRQNLYPDSFVLGEDELRMKLKSLKTECKATLSETCYPRDSMTLAKTSCCS